VAIPLPAVEASFETPQRGAPQRRGDGEASPLVETRSVTVALSEGALPCRVGGADAECVALGDGPFVITDYEALDGCRDRLYLASADLQQSRDADDRLHLDWTVGVSDEGVHGARIAVAPNAQLLAVLQPAHRRATPNPRCTITWSAHRPVKTAPKAPTQPALMESPYR
jgi:hypothetical protein